jgi:hypothetical protein
MKKVLTILLATVAMTGLLIAEPLINKNSIVQKSWVFDGTNVHRIEVVSNIVSRATLTSDLVALNQTMAAETNALAVIALAGTNQPSSSTNSITKTPWVADVTGTNVVSVTTIDVVPSQSDLASIKADLQQKLATQMTNVALVKSRLALLP